MMTMMLSLLHSPTIPTRGPKGADAWAPSHARRKSHVDLLQSLASPRAANQTGAETASRKRNAWASVSSLRFRASPHESARPSGGERPTRSSQSCGAKTAFWNIARHRVDIAP
jgi:hypothetical protein